MTLAVVGDFRGGEGRGGVTPGYPSHVMCSTGSPDGTLGVIKRESQSILTILQEEIFFF